jgi:hypothetical protein
MEIRSTVCGLWISVVADPREPGRGVLFGIARARTNAYTVYCISGSGSSTVLPGRD